MTKPLVIIGGGLAGLYAGYLLHQRNVDFKILEANSRLGGRIFCEPHSNQPENTLGLDMGPAWFWPHQTEMMALIQTLQIDYFQQYNKGEALFEADAQSPIERFMPSYLESFRVVGGMQRVIDKLASSLPDDAMELNCAVERIESIDGIWQLSTRQQDTPIYNARRLIIAAPPRVIIDKLELPGEALQPLKNLLARVPTWMAAQAKFVASYKRAFWREQGLSGQAFSRQGPMVEIHDSSAAENDGFALFGFIGVPASVRQKIPHEELKLHCLTQLAKIFGNQALEVEETYLSDWAINEFIASDADLNEQPAHPSIDLQPYQQALIEKGLYFGSSEVAVRDAGYLQGALVAANDGIQALC
jgi:monoamine oxidase